MPSHQFPTSVFNNSLSSSVLDKPLLPFLFLYSLSCRAHSVFPPVTVYWMCLLCPSANLISSSSICLSPFLCNPSVSCCLHLPPPTSLSLPLLGCCPISQWMHKAPSAIGMSAWGGGAGLSESFPVCSLHYVCVSVCPGQWKYAQNVCHKDNVCVFCVCCWENVLLSHCKAMPHRDGLQGHSEEGGECCPVAWIKDHSIHITHFYTTLLSAIRWATDRWYDMSTLGQHHPAV